MNDMQRTVLVTGAASGIGRATAERLRAQSHRVIGVDLRDADIDADLGTPDGRAHMIERATELAPTGLDGVVACAGIGNPARVREIISVNYFGAVATLEGLRPLLARSKRARAVAVTSTAGFLPCDEDAVRLCLAGEEPAAVAHVLAHPGNVYAASKRALGQWLRATAVRPEWAGAGILLNAVAPGLIDTPMSGGMLTDPRWIDIIKQSNPVAIDGYGAPAEVAELLEFLLGVEGRWMIGQIIYIDGGTDALLRADRI